MTKTDDKNTPKEVFGGLKNSCEMQTDGLLVNWTAKGTGFGQFYFYYKGDKLICDSETMGKEFIKKMLCQMVDDCELYD